MDCPDADQVLAFLKGKLEPAMSAEFEKHVDGCADCRVLLSELVRSSGPAPAGHTVLDTDAQLDPTASAQTRLMKPGGRIGRFLVERVLGVGGMGVVYGGRDEANRPVAIKMMRRSFADEPEMRTRFLREAQLMASIDHRNVVRVYEGGELDGFPWLAMELVEGATLDELQHDLPWSKTLAHYLEAAAGLAAAHAKGIVHRDFKAPNVLVPKGGQAKLGDFGVARGQDSALTRTGQVLGTLHYLAPECLSEGKVSAASDQFALAISLWRGLYGVRPFDGGNPEAIYRAVMQGKPQRSGAPSGVPAAVEAVLLRAMRPRPEERWPDVATMAAELRRAAAPRGARVRIAVAAATGLALAVACQLGWPRVVAEPDAEVVAVRTLARQGRAAEALERAERLTDARAAAGLMLALGAAERALARLPEGDPQTALLRAQALRAAGRDSDALFEKAVADAATAPAAELQWARVSRAAAIRSSRDLRAAVDALALEVPRTDLRLATARLWLGEAMLDEGEGVGAYATLTAAANAFQATLGTVHPATARAHAGLAQVEIAAGNLDAGETLAAQALKQRSAVLGEDHPDLVREWSVLALAAQARHDEPGAKRALAEVARLGGPPH